MSIIQFDDKYYMKQALIEAQKAFEQDEVPVGAVVVSNNQIIARGHNLTEQLNDVTAHAEMQAITAAANAQGGKFLEKCEVYITLEPCVMCAGALFWARPKKIVIGARDEKRGFRSVNKNILHPKTVYQEGIMEEECSEILKTFFQKKRK